MNRIVQSVAVCCAIAALADRAPAQIFISEAFFNPPGSLDDFTEYVELTGTPGMKLDGYAIAYLTGTDAKYYGLGTLPPVPPELPEVDEFFDLSGLALGANGMLVLGITDASSFPTVLPDTAFVDRNNLWTGLAPAGKLNNDGAGTLLLIRNRRGGTAEDPGNPSGILWGKAALHDFQIISPVFDPDAGLFVDQFGDGRVDEGVYDGFSGPTIDYLGKLTGSDFDDLEIVDEVSFESNDGWQYDFDQRQVDIGSPLGGLKQRRVHMLGDPQGFNPDCLTRVDYRTKGAGYAASGSGQAQNGKNWQDTATEQWIRGETLEIPAGSGNFYFDLGANVDPNAIQPYFTNVPLWLGDGSGVDFDFGTATSYPIQAGRVNPLAVPFVPGDVDRDGDCDAGDIGQLAGVFGNDSWIFSNSFPESSYGDAGDPAAQVRPWNVDGTGDNGIEASDLQWVLNFQGSSDGRIKGVTYDSPTPSATGVVLNPNAAVQVAVTAVTSTACGLPLTGVRVGDAISVTVRAQLTSGANLAAGAENGVQQFVHDVLLSAPGVLEVETIDALGAFTTTRALAQNLEGNDGDLGVSRVNGYTTSFTQGLAGAAALYRVTFRAIGAGSTQIAIQPAADAKFAASTPHGVKVGHTAVNGNPAGASQPAAIAVTVVPFTGAGYLTPYGAGCITIDGFTPRLRGEGCPQPGGAITLSIDRGNGGAVPFMFLGVGQQGAVVSPNCALQNLPLVSFLPFVLPALAGVGPGNGTLLLPNLPVPATAPTGISVEAQILFSGVGISSTNPIEIRLGL